jgi:hypothetical protein
VVARVRYSNSVLEWATIHFLREDHEMRLGPRKIQKPTVDFRSSGQPAQSAFEKAQRMGDEERRRSRP